MEKQESTARVSSGKGSFWLSEKVLNELVANATATQICVYLILARYTDATGQYSTCGMTAVKKALGLGDEQTRRALASLNTLAIVETIGGERVERRLVYAADEWTTMTGEVIERPTLKSQVRFYLSSFDTEEKIEKRIWFANTLVDGYGHFRQPLRRLKRLGDVAARLLLMMYRENRMEQFGGVSPYVLFCSYISEKKPAGSHGYELWHATREENTVDNNISLPALGVEELDKNKEIQEKQMQPFWNALEGLQAAGLVYEIVTVFDGTAGGDADVVYELDTRSRHGYKPKGEEGLSGETARLADYWGYPVAVAGRFDGTYGVIIEQGVIPRVASIFRLRFRVANAKNHTVSAAFRRIRGGQSEWHAILTDLLALDQSARAASQGKNRQF